MNMSSPDKSILAELNTARIHAFDSTADELDLSHTADGLAEKARAIRTRLFARRQTHEDEVAQLMLALDEERLAAETNLHVS